MNFARLAMLRYILETGSFLTVLLCLNSLSASGQTDNFSSGKKVDLKEENFKILDKNAENLGNLNLGVEGAGSFGPGDQSLGIGFNGSYRMPKIGEINVRAFTSNKVNSTSYWNDFSEQYTGNEFELNLVKYFAHSKKIEFQSIGLKYLGAEYSNHFKDRTVFYSACEVKRPKFTDYGIRLGALKRQGFGFELTDYNAINQYQTLSIFAGIQKSSRERIVIDYKDCGVRFEHKIKQHYLDVFYAVDMSFDAIHADRPQYKNYFVSDPIPVKQIPFGIRAGWHHYVPWGQQGKFARTSLMEIGVRPTASAIGYGFYFTVGWGLCVTANRKTVQYTSKYEYVPETLEDYEPRDTNREQALKDKKENAKTEAPKKVEDAEPKRPKYKKRTRIGRFLHPKDHNKLVRYRFRD